jgi:hypothetical protein
LAISRGESAKVQSYLEMVNGVLMVSVKIWRNQKNLHGFVESEKFVCFCKVEKMEKFYKVGKNGEVLHGRKRLYDL